MLPLIVYDSMTGNVQRFISKLNCRSLKISKDTAILEPYILVTYTIGFGQIPSSTKEFLSRNSLFLLGVAASGNKNWGLNFCKSAELISKEYGVPIVHTFELSGTIEDIHLFKQEAEKLVNK